MLLAMSRAHHLDDSTVIDRLEAEIEALRRLLTAQGRNIAILMEAAAESTTRQAAIDAGGLLTLKQAAHEAGVASEGTIRFWFSKGLPFETVGIKRYVSRQALAEYVAGRQ
jgi:hypothetical protein